MQLRSKRMKCTNGTSYGKVYDSYFNRDMKHFCSHQHTPFVPEESGYDAVVLHNNILYFAHPVFELYRITGAVMHKDFIKGAMDHLMDSGYQVSTVNLPSNGRVTLMKQPEENRLICHILYAPTILRGGQRKLEGNQWESYPTEIIEDIPDLYNVEITLQIKEDIRKITLQTENIAVDFTRNGDFVTFTVPRFNCHTMAVLDLQ